MVEHTQEDYEALCKEFDAAIIKQVTPLRKSYKCPHCGSREVVWDACTEWCEETQNIQIKDSFDDGFCNACEDSIAPEEIQIDANGDEISMT